MIHVRCSKCDEIHPANQEHKCAKAEPAKKRVVTKAKAVVTPKKRVTTKKHKSASDRVKAWRAANREHYNDYMRKRRAADKAARKPK